MENCDTPYRPSWVTSKEFKFIVGPDKQEFLVHSELVAGQSKPLCALITNGMKESQEGVVAWPHVDIETFKRFVEFLYSGDFETPGFLAIETDPKKRRLHATLAEIGIGDDIMVNHAWKKFKQNTEYMFHQMPTAYQAAELDNNDTLSKGFIAIAKVYSFAHYYDMTNFMDFCRGKLHSLMTYNPASEGVTDLIRLCMNESGADDLKEMVFEYCAIGLQWLLVDERFEDAMEDFPSASFEIMKKLKSLCSNYWAKSRRLRRQS